MKKLGIVQYKFKAETAENAQTVLRMIHSAKQLDVSVLLLPELCLNTYFPADEHQDVDYLMLSLESETVMRIRQKCKELGIAVIFPFFEEGRYNSAIYINEEGELDGHYRKRHIPYDPHFYEKNYFEVGDLGPCIVDSPIGKIGIQICWDQWFPEAAREYANAGAQLLLYPTAIGWLSDEKEDHEHQLNAWVTMQKSHAIANGVFVAAANRVGVEGSIEFWGHSFCVDPFGRDLAVAGKRDEIIVVDIDLSLIQSTRETWPFLRDLRDDYV